MESHKKKKCEKENEQANALFMKPAAKSYNVRNLRVSKKQPFRCFVERIPSDRVKKHLNNCTLDSLLLPSRSYDTELSNNATTIASR